MEALSLRAANPDRKKTAIKRNKLSVPVRQALKHEFITKETTVHDYGCGRCGDINRLSKLGIKATGHDLSFGKKQAADVVLLVYVINVIEDMDERKEVLKEAMSLAKKYLIISARTDKSLKDAIPYRDGLLSRANTFQKIYSNAELHDFILRITGLEPVKLYNGVFYVETGG